MTAAVMAAGVAIPFSPLGARIGLVPLPAAYFPWLLAVLAGYCMLVQAAKSWYLKRFTTWL
jgi:Mg2+-importing ATPase